jgi:hypothetical protein
MIIKIEKPLMAVIAEIVQRNKLSHIFWTVIMAITITLIIIIIIIKILQIQIIIIIIIILITNNNNR